MRCAVGRRALSRSAAALPPSPSSDVDSAACVPPPVAPGAQTPVFGSALRLLRAGGASKLHLFIDARHRALGPVFRDKLGPAEGVFVSDGVAMRKVFALEGPRPSHVLPDAWTLYNQLKGCRRGLFFMDGDEWFHYRRIMNKLLLHPSNADAVLEACEAVLPALFDRWRAHRGRPLPALEDDLYLWSLEVAAALLLGDAFPPRASALRPLLLLLASEVRNIFVHTSRLTLAPARWARALHLSAWSDFEAAVDRTLATADALVERMLEAEGDGLLGRMRGEGVSVAFTKRIVVDLVLAAGDTTVHSLQWLLLCLAKQPLVQEELRAQLRQEGSCARAQAQLPLVRWSVREALRLYPVAPFLTRFLPQRCQVGGFTIEAGTLVLLSLWSSGRNEDYFPRAHCFWPQRWRRLGAADGGGYEGVNNPFASMPFAIGARSCIGRRLAETQLALTVAKLVNDFHVEILNERPVELVLRMVSVPSEPLKLKLTEVTK